MAVNVIDVLEAIEIYNCQSKRTVRPLVLSISLFQACEKVMKVLESRQAVGHGLLLKAAFLAAQVGAKQPKRCHACRQHIQIETRVIAQFLPQGLPGNNPDAEPAQRRSNAQQPA
jgi:hypothetical protein